MTLPTTDIPGFTPNVVPATPVKLGDAFLTDLQANILKFHGRQFALHMFVIFNREKILTASRVIADLAIRSIVTSANKQLMDTDQHKLNQNFDGGPVITMSLSGFGYNKLGQSHHIPQPIITDILTGIQGPELALVHGMKSRAAKLEDKTEIWDEEFRNDIDAVITVADDNLNIATMMTDMIAVAFGQSATVVKIQKGEILRNEHGIGIEHFGYADGISQPIYLADEYAEEDAHPRKQWSEKATLNGLLVKDPGSTNENGFGSFLVFRKLEQNVLAFKTEEKKLPSVNTRLGSVNDELAGAMIVGRFEDGTEVVNADNERQITNSADLTNDFDYRDDKTGLRCPFHAHIRITNPRADISIDFAKQVRLTRRGIPYNDINRDVSNLDQHQPESGVGLLFQCYQSSITNQFEFIQKAWANDGDIGGKPVGMDGIIGQGADVNPPRIPRTLPNQWDKPDQSYPISFSGFVTNKGGEYFFTPSISFLSSLVN